MDSEARNGLCGKDLIALSDFDPLELNAILLRSIELQELWHKGEMPDSLSGKRIGLVQDLPGWRNPVALQLGVNELGANCVRLDISLSGAEETGDLARYIDNWFDCIAIRTPSLVELRKFSTVLRAPVVNLRTNDNHPCEILGDLAYVLKQRGTLDGLKVVAAAPSGNILKSWIEAAKVLGFELCQFTASQFFSEDMAEGQISTSSNPESLFEADVIVTDCRPPNMGGELQNELLDVQITADLLDKCRQELLFIPCPPVTRGQEVSSAAMDHPSCCSFEAKEFLLHVQNAAIESILTR